MNAREELVALRRLAELEAKANGGKKSGGPGSPERIAELEANLPTVEKVRRGLGRNLGEEFVRQLGLIPRYGIEGGGGVVGLPATLIDLATGLVDKAGILPPIPKFDSARQFSHLADSLGLPNPEGATERVVGDAARFMSGAGAMGSAAHVLAPMASQALRPAVAMLARNPGLQQASAALGGAAGGVARENDVGPLGQFGATMAGSLLAPSAVQSVKWLGGHLLNPAATIAAGFGHKPSIVRLAGHAAKNIAGDSRQQILDSFKNRIEYVEGAKPSVAESIAQANINKPYRFGSDTVALEQSLSRQPGYGDIIRSGRDAYQLALRRPVEAMAGGATQQERVKAVADAIANRGAITGPMRDQALAQANIGGVKGQQLQARINQRLSDAADSVADFRRLSVAGGKAAMTGDLGRMRLDGGAPPVPGLPRISGRYSYGRQLSGVADKAATAAAEKSLQRGSEARFAQMQLDSIAESGFKQLNPAKIASHINRVLANPGEGISSLNQKVLGAVRDKIDEAVQMNGGRLDARALYTIRKQEVGDIVAALTKDSATATKRHGASLVATVKSQIDDAIEDAIGNTGAWSGPKGYLKTHADLSNKIDRMRVSEGILEKMGADTGKMTPSGYLRSLRSGESNLIRHETGTNINKTMEELYSPAQAKVLRNIEMDMARRAKADQMAADVQGGKLADLTSGELPKPPTLLSRPMMAVNFGLKIVAREANTPVARELAKMMLDPGEYAKLLALPAKHPLRVQAESVLRAAVVAASQYQGEM